MNASTGKVKMDMREMYIPNSETWVYEENQRIVGFISMMVNEIGGLFVLPQKHSKGIGTKLVDYVSKFHKQLEVEVFKRNSIGRSFYRKYGSEVEFEYIHKPSEEKVLRLRKDV